MCKECCNKGGCVCAMVVKVLVIIGGVNWGLVGVGMLMSSDWNVVKMLLGSWPMVEGIVYVLVGLAALAHIFGCRCSKCKDACAACCESSTPEQKSEVKV